MTDQKHDASDEDDDGQPDDQFYVPAEKPQQIEKWKVPGAEGLPDEVKSTPIKKE